MRYVLMAILAALLLPSFALAQEATNCPPGFVWRSATTTGPNDIDTVTTAGCVPVRKLQVAATATAIERGDSVVRANTTAFNDAVSTTPVGALPMMWGAGGPMVGQPGWGMPGSVAFGNPSVDASVLEIMGASATRQAYGQTMVDSWQSGQIQANTAGVRANTALIVGGLTVEAEARAEGDRREAAARSAADARATTRDAELLELIRQTRSKVLDDNPKDADDSDASSDSAGAKKALKDTRPKKKDEAEEDEIPILFSGSAYQGKVKK